MTLELRINSWIAAGTGSDEVRQTLASFSIMLSGRVATRVADDWSKSIRDEVYLSAYPLALWFALSWWRLRWEPTPYNNAIPAVSWGMAHELAAAGCGFLWPRLTLESDGERIYVACHRTNMTSIEPVRYIEDFGESIPYTEFESAVDAFIELVLARLHVVGIQKTQLRAIWEEVRAERADPAASRYRRLEAMLGYEPDEAPEEIVTRLEDLATDIGEAAVSEIASAYSGDDPASAINHVIERANSQGIDGQIQQSGEMIASFNSTELVPSAPWERGWQLARLARSYWGLTTDSVSDVTLSDLMKLNKSVFTPEAADYPRETIGLAVRNRSSDKIKFLFRKQNRAGRRFEATRFLGDYLVALSSDHWLPVTDAKTARQKVQRAFAAEFLCPISALQEFLRGDYSDEAIDEASAYFQVSPLTVSSHLANNYLLCPSGTI